MASVTPSGAVPKLRSRKHGAAVPLDELDRRLLNLMQGSFPLAPRPYAAVAARPGSPRSRCSPACSSCSTSASSARSRRSTTRARSATGRCSSPPRSTPRTHGRRRRSSTPTPASRTTTCATTSSTCGSRSPSSATRSSGSTARSRCCSGSPAPSRSASCRRCKLFKIRMDLEMEGDTKALASAGVEAGAPVELEPVALRRPRHRRHPRDAGRPAGRSPSRTRPPRHELGMGVDAAARAHGGHAGARPAAPRRGDPLPPPRRVLAPTAWACGRCPTSASPRSGR